MAAATKDTIAIPHCATAANDRSARNAAHCSLPRLNFLSIEYNGVKDPALILINAS